uniref:Uncharacterized protein n=1 Tax=Urocitellus parryii TaxID=9999 RepID=A0A8D2I060_UROPR
MDTESTATAAITLELVSTDKIEYALALSTSANKVRNLDVTNAAPQPWTSKTLRQNKPLFIKIYSFRVV